MCLKLEEAGPGLSPQLPAKTWPTAFIALRFCLSSMALVPSGVYEGGSGLYRVQLPRGDVPALRRRLT